MNYHRKVKLIECPRDAMQGLSSFVPTPLKAKYINALLKLGFDTIDFGSFVSPKAVPQMKDTEEVLKRLDLSDTNTSLLAIVPNEKGALMASAFQEINYLGFPLSLSPTFQYNNTRQSIEEALVALGKIQTCCIKSRKELVVYLSMAFGNPYGDRLDHDLLLTYIDKLDQLEVTTVALADTVGRATTKDLKIVGNLVKQKFPQIEWGMHLHASRVNMKEKIQAALASGCSRIDGALMGYGGCPFAQDELVGNIDSLLIMDELGERSKLEKTGGLQEAMLIANDIFD